jgi:Flp pilus assembly protein TadG
MKPQKGATMVEFAIIALLFFMLLFSAIEVARWMFTWNTLVEATRRGARIATVCPFNDNYIKVATVFGEPSQPDSAQTSPVLNGLSTNNVSINYYTVNPLNATTGTMTLDQNPGINKANIRFVEVSIKNAAPWPKSEWYTTRFIAPVIGDILGTIVPPTFRTVMSVESLGDQQKTPNHCY